jgi:hypothetical protein
MARVGWVAWLLVAAVGCNQVFDIRETASAADDRDADGVDDTLDNCVDVPNPDQADGDLDLLGDACDVCPATPGDDQHDEDHDGLGDDCDPCPALRDFGADENGDQVGDLCEPKGGTSERLMFEPLVGLGSNLTLGPVPWIAIDDEAFPMGLLPVSDPGLQANGIVLDTNTWWVSVGTRSLERWGDEERFGMILRNVTSGQPFISCIVTCTIGSTCQFVLGMASATSQTLFTAVAVPSVDLVVSASYNSTTQTTTYACVLTGVPTRKLVTTGVPPTSVSPRFIASENVHLRHIEIVR